MRGVQLLVRGIALLILLAGFISVATSAQPRNADYTEFASALDRGAVALVVIDESPSSEQSVWTATWSTGPYQWRHGPVTADHVTAAQFTGRMSDRGVRVKEDDGDDDTFLIRWPFQDSSGFGVLLGLTWLATFVVMLSSRPRWGNRWAWFWMFVIGQIGILIYLLIEPRPLWRPRPGNVAAPDRTENLLGCGEHPDGGGLVPAVAARESRVGGGWGCMYSVVTSFGAGILAGALGWASGYLLP